MVLNRSHKRGLSVVGFVPVFNVKDRDEPNNRQGADQSRRSNVPTARLPTLVRQAETDEKW